MSQNDDLQFGRTALCAAIEAGPAACAKELVLLLSGLSVGDEQIATTSDWVADIYGTVLSLDQRACVRDGILNAIEDLLTEVSDDCVPTLVSILDLAERFDVLKDGGDSRQERLWNSVNDCEKTDSAALVVSHLAQFGRTRSPNYWAEIYADYGSPVAIACAEAVLRHGAGVTIRWLYRTMQEPLRLEVMSAIVEQLIAVGAGDVLAFINSGAREDQQSRTELTTLLARYGIELPSGPVIYAPGAGTLIYDQMVAARSISALDLAQAADRFMQVEADGDHDPEYVLRQLESFDRRTFSLEILGNIDLEDGFRSAG